MDSQPSAHCEANELGLVEVLGQIASLEGVEGAEEDEDEVPHERGHEGPGGGGAHQHQATLQGTG
jgi:hypothetical protein